MERKRIQLLVEVDTDPVPGWGNDPNDYVEHIQNALNNTIPHYNPVVLLLPSDDRVIPVMLWPTEDRVLPARETETSGP